MFKLIAWSIILALSLFCAGFVILNRNLMLAAQKIVGDIKKGFEQEKEGLRLPRATTHDSL